jgi:hypothetical protein
MEVLLIGVGTKIFFKEGKIMYTSSYFSKVFNRVLLVTAAILNGGWGCQTQF